MADSKRYMDWLNKASEDYESALILYRNRGSLSNVVFFCQQAVEKALKGYILKHQKVLIDGHSLVFLCRKTMDIDDFFRHFLNDCAFLNQFYLESRYPADIPMDVTDAEANKCIEIAKVILGRIRQVIDSNVH